MFPEDFTVLPAKFHYKKWLEFFQDIGLKQVLSQNEYIKFCNKTVRGEVKDVKKCSHVLIEYLFSAKIRNLWCHDQEFLRTVSLIPFVCTVPTPSVDWIMPGAHQASQMVKMNGSASNIIHHLLWTVKPIIKYPGIEYYMDTLLLNLNIAYQATVTDVVSNISNISKKSPYSEERLFRQYPDNLVLSKENNLLDIMLKHFEFLSCNIQKISPASTLGALPCVPVHCDLHSHNKNMIVLVRPECVLHTCDDEYYPYLHQLPGECRLLSHFFSQIGVKNKMELHHIQIVLQKVYNSTEGEQMDPNTMTCVKKGIRFLMDSLKGLQSEVDSIESALFPLYLPDTHDYLKLSTSMIYRDTPSYFDRKDLDLAGTQYSHFDIKENIYDVDAFDLCCLLPEIVRPVRMSVICRQIPVDECESAEDSECIQQMSDCIRDERSASDIVKVFEKFVNYKQSNTDEIMRSVENFCHTLKIITKHNLRTNIVLKDSGKYIGDLAPDYYFIPSDPQPILYLDSNTSDCNEVFEEISEHLFNIIVAHNPDERVLSDLKSKIVRAISQYLKADTPAKKLKFYSKYQIQGTEEDTSKLTLDLGEDIPECWHHRLDVDPHNVFNPMEKVGYEYREGYFKVAQIVHPLDSKSGSNLIRRYKIYTSKDDTDGKNVSVLDLYKFVVGHKKPKVSLNRSEEENSAMIPYEGEDKVKTSLFEADLVYIKKSIFEQLKEISLLSPELRRKAIRRLYLRWHPDKNLENPSKAEKIFVFLKRQIDHLDKNEPFDNPQKDYFECPQTSSSRERDFHNWNNTAKAHSQARKTEQASTRKNSRPGWTSFKNEKKPKEGWRWVRQAKMEHAILIDAHLQAGKNSSYGHVCFMAHQVAEKALKGAVYALCGMDSRNLNVSDYALSKHAYALEAVKPSNTQGLADLSTPLEKYYLDTRYPYCWPGCTDIPADHYTQAQADEAQTNAKAILDIVISIMPPMVG